MAVRRRALLFLCRESIKCMYHKQMRAYSVCTGEHVLAPTPKPTLPLRLPRAAIQSLTVTFIIRYPDKLTKNEHAVVPSMTRRGW